MNEVKALDELDEHFTVINRSMLSSRWSGLDDSKFLSLADVHLPEVLGMAGTPNVLILFGDGETLSLLSIQAAIGNFEDALRLLEMGALVDSTALEHWLMAGEALAQAMYASCSAQVLRQKLQQEGSAIEDAETLERYVKILSKFPMKGDEELLVSKLLSRKFVSNLVTNYERVLSCVFRKDFRKLAGHLLRLLRENGPEQ